MAEELAKTLLTKISEEGHHSSAKVTVVGTGQVGMAAAFAMMTQVRFKFSRVRAICSKSTVFFLDHNDLGPYKRKTEWRRNRGLLKAVAVLFDTQIMMITS